MFHVPEKQSLLTMQCVKRFMGLVSQPGKQCFRFGAVLRKRDKIQVFTGSFYLFVRFGAGRLQIDSKPSD
jgi:hypothetical protein